MKRLRNKKGMIGMITLAELAVVSIPILLCGIRTHLLKSEIVPKAERNNASGWHLEATKSLLGVR